MAKRASPPLPNGITHLMPWCVIGRSVEAEKRAYVDGSTIKLYWMTETSFLPCTSVTSEELQRIPFLLEVASPEWRRSVLPSAEATPEDVVRWWGMKLGPVT